MSMGASMTNEQIKSEIDATYKAERKAIEDLHDVRIKLRAIRRELRSKCTHPSWSYEEGPNGGEMVCDICSQCGSQCTNVVKE